MKLDLDCVRDVLLTIEEQQAMKVTGLGQIRSVPLTIRSISDCLKDYDKADIAYTLVILKEGGFVDANISQTDSIIANIVINRLTYSGHEYLQSIKDNTNWNKVKSVATKLGAYSLSFVGDIAKSVLSSAIQAALLT